MSYPTQARLSLAIEFAALSGAVLLLSGAIPASVVALVVLIAVPNAMNPDGARAAWQAPVWVGVALVAAVRAGSLDLVAIRGAHAIAGLAIVHGSPASVCAAWLGVGAGALVIAPTLRSHMRSSGARESIRMAVTGVQALAVVALFAGPQVRSGLDLVPWALTVVGLLAAAMVLRDRVRSPWFARAAVVAAGLAVVLVHIGSRG